MKTIMGDTNNKLNKLLSGKTTPKETLNILETLAIDPALEEQVVSMRRAAYSKELMDDYGSFIPVGSMAADDDSNMCDFKCELKILGLAGKNVPQEELASTSRRNYWLRSLGTPLFNMGKLLEKEGFLVNRKYDASINDLIDDLKKHYVIVVVNGDVLKGINQDVFADDFSFEDNPNHAVLVLSVDQQNETVELYNPAEQSNSKQYTLGLFVDAWSESHNYTVTVREKSFPEEYNPQPIDVESITLNPELEELTDFIAENAHDVWAKDKKADGYTYAPVDDKTHNHYLKPFSMLSEKDKEPDRRMAINTIKLLKRMGYRIVNVSGLYKCPECGEAIEPNHNFCPNCGKQLSWEDFK